MYPLSLFIWYIPLESMMVGELFLIVQLNDGVEHNLQEWIQLGENQPNINHPYIGGGWQFCHDTKIRQWWHWMKTFWWPDKKSGGHQQDGQVDSDSSFKVDGFEEWSSIAHENQEEGGEVGGQQLVGQPPLEHYLHLQTIRWGSCNNICSMSMSWKAAPGLLYDRLQVWMKYWVSSVSVSRFILSGTNSTLSWGDNISKAKYNVILTKRRHL